MDFKCLPLPLTDVKFDDGRAGFFSGYASVFNGVDSYGDTILPGAYGDTLKNRQRPVMMRWNHFGPVIGKWVRVEEDAKGLLVEGELTPGHSVAQDVFASLKHGAVNGLSIGYRIPSGGSEKDGRVRKIKRIDLVEVSVVEEPADLAARIGDVKSAIEEIASLADAEAVLREAGRFSRADATTLVARIKSLCAHGEREDQKQAAEIAALIQRIRLPASS